MVTGLSTRLGHLLRLTLATALCVQLLAVQTSHAETCPVMKGAADTLATVVGDQRYRYIVRVLERKEAGRTPFTETQTAIRKRLEGKRKQELIKGELVRLRKNSRVWTVFDGDISGPRLAELLDQPKKR